MEWIGFALLILVGVGIISTGLPAAFVLIAVASLGAVLGLASGTIPFSLLGALPSRLINLFDNDLLQALPLHVTMGLLLGRLPVADALYRTSNAILPKRASAPLVSGMLLGALLGPMNGSVGASVLGLSRVVAPRLTAEGLPPATRDAALAGSDPAQRCDAQCAYPCGDRDRPHRPCHQHARYISRRAVAGSDLSVAMFRALLVCRTERHQAAPARKAYGQTGAARRIRTCGTAGAARRRRHRILLCRRSGGHGCLHLAECRSDQRPLARRRVTRTPA